MSSSRSQAYTDAGVNINAGNELVSRIKSLVASTRIPGVVSDIGGFGGLFRPELQGMKSPVLVSSTDGVGTKLKLAALFDRHDTVGIDLVAMSVNDILVQGAKPLFFLDYFATGELNVAQAEAVVGGVAEGCRRGGCALLGGETAEMPGMYAKGDYDLAGFCVGIADMADIVDGSAISPGDAVLGLASSGVHSNGYTLVRKLFEACGASADDMFPGTDRSFRDVLLEPTVIYTRILEKLLQGIRAKGMVHVTGGGFYDNIPRVLPKNTCARIDFGSWDMPPVFEWLREQGKLTWPEMLQIFNCGIGYIVIVDKAEAEDVLKRAHVLNSRAWKIGEIRALEEQDKEQVDILFD